ncbi:hypothetical protein Cni_G12810 [Canna indica]|uniref:Uncharacterized protein n=1 Tax=Canna indica TaxID=4628 RepID=A0AAQ3K8V1_9LILI|nr:hypothetical protein Cni_G12810 [Canna indica]
MLSNFDAAGHRQGSVSDFKHKVIRQRQQLKYLREASLWIRIYDYVVRLLGRSIFSIAGRMKQVFELHTKAEPMEYSGNRKKFIVRLSRRRLCPGSAIILEPSG